MITARGLVKRFGERIVLNGVDLEAREGEVFGLLGPNGAGKTTVINILSAKLRPDEGEVRIDGLRLPGDEAGIKKKVGVVPQEAALYRRLSISENIELISAMHGIGREERGRICRGLLDGLDISEYADRRASECSSGIRQAASIMMGLANLPDNVLMDEPTVGLDPRIRNSLWDLLKGMAERGKTVLLTTHALDEAERHCDRIAFLHRGRIIAVGTPAEVKRSVEEMRVAAGKSLNGLEDAFFEITEGPGC